MYVHECSDFDPFWRVMLLPDIACLSSFSILHPFKDTLYSAVFHRHDQHTCSGPWDVLRRGCDEKVQAVYHGSS